MPRILTDLRWLLVFNNDYWYSLVPVFWSAIFSGAGDEAALPNLCEFEFEDPMAFIGIWEHIWEELAYIDPLVAIPQWNDMSE